MARCLYNLEKESKQVWESSWSSVRATVLVSNNKASAEGPCQGDELPLILWEVV